MALNDLAGRHSGLSRGMFGGPVRETLRPMYLLGNPSVGDVAEAHKKIKEGYTFFKLKVGISIPPKSGSSGRDTQQIGRRSRSAPTPTW